MTKIFVYIMDEGTDVWRPVDAEHLGEDLYRITSVNSDPEDEHWQFKTGETVRCAVQQLTEGSSKTDCLVAIEAVSIMTSYNKLYKAVREILIDWDPIGVLEDLDCPKDEYDSYIPEICKILANSNELTELRQKLNSIVEGKMGLTHDSERNSDFADKLWRLRNKPEK